MDCTLILFISGYASSAYQMISCKSNKGNGMSQPLFLLEAAEWLPIHLHRRGVRSGWCVTHKHSRKNPIVCATNFQVRFPSKTHGAFVPRQQDYLGPHSTHGLSVVPRLLIPVQLTPTPYPSNLKPPSLPLIYPCLPLSVQDALFKAADSKSINHGTIVVFPWPCLRLGNPWA